ISSAHWPYLPASYKPTIRASSASSERRVRVGAPGARDLGGAGVVAAGGAAAGMAGGGAATVRGVGSAGGAAGCALSEPVSPRVPIRKDTAALVRIARPGPMLTARGS